MTRLAFVGIGNPEDEYGATFHNAGAAFVAELAGGLPWTERAHVRYGTRDGVAYAQTRGYMNESGRGVRELLDWLKLSPAELVLVHDDTDQALGSAKLVSGGGAGGHNGVKSVIEALGTPEFRRLKIGARPERFAGTPHIKAESFVLNRMGAEERELLYGTGFGAGMKLARNVIENAMPSGPERRSAMGSVTPDSD